MEIVNKQIIDPAVIKKVSDLEDEIDRMCDELTNPSHGSCEGKEMLADQRHDVFGYAQ